VQESDDKVSYTMWSDPKRTATLMCDYALAGDVRKQTERTVNVQSPNGTRRHYPFQPNGVETVLENNLESRSKRQQKLL
jgi:hypothetical protein